MFGKKMATFMAQAAKNAPKGTGSGRGIVGVVSRLMSSPEVQARLKNQMSNTPRPEPRQLSGIGNAVSRAARQATGMKKGGAVKKKMATKAKTTMKAKAGKK